jgi:hypothetical protein
MNDIISLVFFYADIKERDPPLQKYLRETCFTRRDQKKKKGKDEYVAIHLNPDKFNFAVYESTDGKSECTIEVTDRIGTKGTTTYPLYRHYHSQLVGDYWYFMTQNKGVSYKVFVYWFM